MLESRTCVSRAVATQLSSTDSVRADCAPSKNQGAVSDDLHFDNHFADATYRETMIVKSQQLPDCGASVFAGLRTHLSITRKVSLP